MNTATINASYRNGILKIVMQRVEEKRGQPKKIPLGGRIRAEPLLTPAGASS